MEKLQHEITSFIRKRNWQKFHSPKNLAMALTVETAELLEIFQWMTQNESKQPSPEVLSHIEEEIGDVMIYLTQLAASLGLEPIAAAHKKLLLNAEKYPLHDSNLNPDKGNQCR